MPTETGLLQQAVQLSLAGEKKRAAQILIDLIKQNEDHELAWWRLADCVEHPQQKRDCLQRVLRINPLHSGARLALFQLQAQQATPELPGSDESAADPAYATTHRLSGSGASLRQSLIETLQTDPQVKALAGQAARAEAGQDFQAAYQCYEQMLAIDSSHTLAWLGKGYAAGRLSTPSHNGIPEFFDCLTRAVLSRDRYGLTLPQALCRLDPEIAAALIDRLRHLIPAVARLAKSSPPEMANIYAIERVRLADSAFAASQCLASHRDQTGARAGLASIALDAFSQIISLSQEATPNNRSRYDLLLIFRDSLLGNLSASQLNADPGFLNQVDDLIARS